MSTAVLLMAYGGPDSLADIEPYLLDVRGGRPTNPQLVAEIRERYAKIGGRSPLLEITCAQATRLEEQLNLTQPCPTRVYVGMRHWKPYIHQALEQIAADGYTDVVAICMAPHASRFSTGAYRKKLDEAAQGKPVTVHFVESWHDQPEFIRAIVENARAEAQKFTPAQQTALHYLFSAHSIPVSAIEAGDPYVDQLHETARLAAEGLGLSADQWSFCYQSAGNIPGQWLGPQIGEYLPQLAKQGVKNVLCTAVGFVADHVEVLYDLDIEARGQAEQLGMNFRRTPSPNVTPAFIEALAQIVDDTIQKDITPNE